MLSPVDSSARWPCCSTVWNPLHWWLIRTRHMHEQQEHIHLAVVAAVSGCILIHLLGAKGVISTSLRCRAWSMTSSSIALCLSRVPPKSYSHGEVQKPFHVSEAWAVPLCFSSQPTKPVFLLIQPQPSPWPWNWTCFRPCARAVDLCCGRVCMNRDGSRGQASAVCVYSWRNHHLRRATDVGSWSEGREQRFGQYGGSQPQIRRKENPT